MRLFWALALCFISAAAYSQAVVFDTVAVVTDVNPTNGDTITYLRKVTIYENGQRSDNYIPVTGDTAAATNLILADFIAFTRTYAASATAVLRNPNKQIKGSVEKATAVGIDLYKKIKEAFASQGLTLVGDWYLKTPTVASYIATVTENAAGVYRIKTTEALTRTIRVINESWFRIESATGTGTPDVDLFKSGKKYGSLDGLWSITKL